MRLTLIVTGLALLAFSCSSSGSSSGETQTFTAAEVKPTIEGAWKGSLVKGADSTATTLTLTYAAPSDATVKSLCSNRTLNSDEPEGTLQPSCFDVSNVNLKGVLVIPTSSTNVSGTLMITEATYTGRGEVSLQDAANNRINARLEDGKLVGTAALVTGEYSFTLTR